MKCIKCGNCCRVGGPCSFLTWRSLEHHRTRDDAFEGTCPELLPDNLCGVAVKAYAGKLKPLANTAIACLDRFFAEDCTRPDLRKPKGDENECS